MQGFGLELVACELVTVITKVFSYLADTFIQSDLQMSTMEAIKIIKRAMILKFYNKSVSLPQYT